MWDGRTGFGPVGDKGERRHGVCVRWGGGSSQRHSTHARTSCSNRTDNCVVLYKFQWGRKCGCRGLRRVMGEGAVSCEGGGVLVSMCGRGRAPEHGTRSHPLRLLC